jgi:hypothetical protein
VMMMDGGLNLQLHIGDGPLQAVSALLISSTQAREASHWRRGLFDAYTQRCLGRPASETRLLAIPMALEETSSEAAKMLVRHTVSAMLARTNGGIDALQQNVCI